MVRSVVTHLLEEWGFKALEAENGKEGLRLARQLNGTLGLVISDLTMPQMDGLEFATAFRKLYPGVPILFMTGRSSTSLADTFSGGRDHLLFKPFDPDTFLDAVARLLESRLNQRSVPA
jgi:two-component system, cell cycle sensor histidine kinase and response regulator CckA